MTTAPNDYDIFQVVLEDFITSGTSLEDMFERLNRVFNDWLGNISTIELKELLLPKFEVSIDSLIIGLQFPVSIFKQVDNVTNEPIEINGEYVPGIVTFDLGSLKYSTGNGLNFSDINDLSINFTKSEILNTGFTLEVHNMKLDPSITGILSKYELYTPYYINRRIFLILSTPT